MVIKLFKQNMIQNVCSIYNHYINIYIYISQYFALASSSIRPAMQFSHSEYMHVIYVYNIYYIIHILL